MPKRSKLLQALDDHKGRDYDAERQKKQVKTVEKRKKAKKEKKGEEEGDAVEKKEQEEHDKVCAGFFSFFLGCVLRNC